MANELWIYDVIGAGFFEEGVTAKSVRDDLAKADKSKPLTVYINSPGGLVSDGLAIHTMLSQWSAGVDVQIDGIAASAASFIAMAGKTISMAKGAFMMIHNAHTFAIGDHNALRKEADTLEKVSGSLADMYVDRTGIDRDEVLRMMDAETWFTAQEAVDAGFADSVAEAADAAAFVIPSAFAFKHPPQEPAAPTPRTASRAAAMNRRILLTREKL